MVQPLLAILVKPNGCWDEIVPSTIYWVNKQQLKQLTAGVHPRDLANSVLRLVLTEELMDEVLDDPRVTGGSMRVYITKYVCTRGILEADVSATSQPDMVSLHRYEMFLKPDWHETLEEAQEQAQKMLLAKLRSLDKQRKRLEGISLEKTSEL
jgi:hypothetical protein